MLFLLLLDPAGSFLHVGGALNLLWPLAGLVILVGIGQPSASLDELQVKWIQVESAGD